MKKILSLLVLTVLSTLLISCDTTVVYNMEERTDIIVGLEAAYAPFNWAETNSNEFTHKLENQSGYVDGFDVQMAKEIARILDKELVIKAIDWDGLIPALESGQIDLVIAGMSPTSDRKEFILFSDEYYRSEFVMVVSRDGAYANATSISDFDGARVVAQRGTLYDDVIDQIPNVTHQTPLDAYSNLTLAVSAGTSDAFVAELPVAQSIINANPELAIVRFAANQGFDSLDEDITVAVGLRKSDAVLLEAINGALALISNETRNSWMDAAVLRSQE